MIRQNGDRPLAPNHPANFCMFVLVSMNDDGLLVWPTHRLIGGLEGFDVQAFAKAISPNFTVTPAPVGPERMAEYVDQVLPKEGKHTFGLYDGRTRKLYEGRLKNADVLRELEPSQSDAWRRLDVAILQRYMLDEVIQPSFAEGTEIAKGYTADASQIVPQVNGDLYQVALLLQSTPLHALEELGKHNEVMPQKSTYFYPKLATGMVINSLR